MFCVFGVYFCSAKTKGIAISQPNIDERIMSAPHGRIESAYRSADADAERKPFRIFEYRYAHVHRYIIPLTAQTAYVFGLHFGGNPSVGTKPSALSYRRSCVRTLERRHIAYCILYIAMCVFDQNIITDEPNV